MRLEFHHRPDDTPDDSYPELAPPIDRIEIPEYEIRPPEPPRVPECPPGPGDREELELALERARLVADDCASILAPAVQAMQDGAWISRRADEFSLELDDNIRQATEAGQDVVQVIEEALNRQDGAGEPVILPEEVEFDQPVILPADGGRIGDA